MSINTDNILEIAVQLSKQFTLPYAISSLEIENDVWTLISDDVLTCSEKENMQKFMWSILRATSKILPNNLELDALFPYLSLMIPNLPMDFVAVLNKVWRGDIETVHELQQALAQALELQKDRSIGARMDKVFWNIGYDTHIGRRKAWLSQTNQDNFFYAVHDQVAIFAVADGISTANAGSGDMASAIAMHLVHKLWEKNKTEFATMEASTVVEFLYHMLYIINQEICDVSKKVVKGSILQAIPMGTTIIIGIAQGSTVHMASLGDSRIYALLESGIAQVTGDQNVCGERLRYHVPVNSTNEGFELVRYLGRFGAPENNTMEADFIPPDFFKITLLPGESLLFCSDGITDYIGNTYGDISTQIAKSVSKGDPMEVCWDLTHQANRGGGGDNITSVFATLEILD